MTDHGSNIELILLGLIACVIVYSLLTKAISRTVVTLPMIFTGLGLLAAEPTKMLAEPEVLDATKRFLAEVTLIIVLFADASHVRFSELRQNYKLPLRMLVIGMPLSILLGTLIITVLNPGAGIAMALLTAALLTPTDAALGQTVVSSTQVPLKLRQTINVESGLNDGLALPFVLLGAILASGSVGADGLLTSAIIQIVLGPLAGIVVGWGVAKLLGIADERDWSMESARGVVFLTTAFAAFLAAEIIGGNGFIAAFVAGAVFGNSYRNDLHFISEFMEGNGQLLTMSSFFVFGALLLPNGLEHLSVFSVSVGILFLTIVRIAPIVLSLWGTGLHLKEKLFLGWFGPRGLASILFTLIILDEYEFPGEAELLACVSVTVLLSIILHGLTAAPLAQRIGRSTKTDCNN